MNYYIQLPNNEYVEVPQGVSEDEARARIMRDPRFRPIIEQAISEQSSVIPDLGGSVVRGLGSLPTAAGRLTDLVPGMQGNLVSRGLISAGESISNYGTSLMSHGGQMQQRLFQAVMDEAENQGLVDQAKIALREAISNPRMLANITAENIPSLVASFGGGLAVRGAAAVGSRLAGRQLGAEGARRAAVAGAIGTESLLEGGVSADDVYKQIKGLPEEELQKSPEYQELLRGGLKPEDARESLARSAARQAGLQTAAISGTIGAALPGVETMPFARASTATRGRRALTGAGTELGQEGGQEGGAALSENIARQRAEIDRELTAGVGSRAALGAVVGGITGGAFGGLRSSSPEVDRTEDAELRNILNEYVNVRGEAPVAPAAISERDAEAAAFVAANLPVSEEMFLAMPEAGRTRVLAIARNRADRVAASEQEQGFRQEAETRAATEGQAEQVRLAEEAEARRIQNIADQQAQAQEETAAITSAGQEAITPSIIRTPQEELSQAVQESRGTRGPIGDATTARYIEARAMEAPNQPISIPAFQQYFRAQGLPVPTLQQARDTLDKYAEAANARFVKPRFTLNLENGRYVPVDNDLQAPQAAQLPETAPIIPPEIERPLADLRKGLRKPRNKNPEDQASYQARRDAADQLEAELFSRDLTPQSSDVEIAEAFGYRGGQPREEYSGRKPRGPIGGTAPMQMSIPQRFAAKARPPATPEEQAAQQEATNKAQADDARRVEILRKLNAEYLAKLEAKGSQGKRAADAVRNNLQDRTLSVEQLYGAFKGAEIIANTLPANANHEIEFVKYLTDAAGKEVQGKRIEVKDSSTAGIIKLSLAENQLPLLSETASHEAFHVLQDYYGKYDPDFRKLMKQSFRDGMTINDVDSTIKRKLQTTRMPNGRQSYWDVLVESLPDEKLSGREAEAYVFGSLAEASRRGVPMTGLKPAFTRFVNMLTKFTRRMGNALRDDGFNSPDDVFGRVVEGDAGRFAAEAAPEFRGGEEFSARTLPKVSSTYQSAIDKVTGTYGQEPDSLFRRALDGLTGARAKYTMLYGGDKPQRVKASDSLVMSSVNQFHAGHLADQLLKSKGRPDAAVIGRSWESANNNDARIAYMMNGGGYRLDKTRGVLVRDPKVKSIKDMFANKVPTDEAGQKRFQTYAVANLERDLRKQGKKGFLNLTDTEIASVIQESERSFPQWKEVIKDLNNWNNSLLQLLVDAGNIDQATKDKLMQVFYTPLYRKMEDDAYHNADMVMGPATAGTFKNPSDALKRREGGEEPIGDLFENIVRNADAIVKSALKNVAMENTAKGLEIAGLAERVPAKLDGAKNIMTLRRDGKDVHYRVDDPLMMIAISTAPMQIQNGFYKTMASISGFIRDMITLAPSFMLANLWRGKVVSYVQEGVPLWRSTTVGLRDALKQTSSMTSIGDVTGFGGYTWGQGSQDLVSELKRQVRLADGTASMLDRAKSIVQGLRHIGEATEFAERVKVVDHLISKGMNPDDAAFQGYLLAPFSRRGMGTGFFGSTASFLAPIVPFLNAKIQGTYRLLENEKNLPKHKFAMQLMARGAVVTMFSMALAALASDDERWENEPVERKMLYDIFYVGDKTILLPRAFEVGTWFGAIPVMLFDAARREHGGDLGKAFAFALTNTLGFSPIPASVAPLITVGTNYDFFMGRELESAGMRSRPASERSQEDTSRVAEGVAYAINNSLGELPRGMRTELSPIQVQALLQGYLGTSGAMILSALDGFLGWSGMTPGKPVGPLGDPNSPLGIATTLTGVRRFVKGDEEKVSRFVGDFYDLKREVTQWTTAMNDARLAGDMARANEIASERSDLFALKRQVDKASRDVGEISRRMRAIQNNPNMDPQEKADALVPLRQRRNEITGRIMEQAVDRGVR